LKKLQNLRLTFGCLRRFFVRDKGIAKQFQRTKKCGGTKTHKGAKPRLRFCGARAPEGGEA